MIRECVAETTTMMSQSLKLYNEAKKFLLERDIRWTRHLSNGCKGCSDLHFDQIRHERSFSALTSRCTEEMTWNEIVDEYFEDANKGKVSLFAIRCININ